MVVDDRNEVRIKGYSILYDIESVSITRFFDNGAVKAYHSAEREHKARRNHINVASDGRDQKFPQVDCWTRFSFLFDKIALSTTRALIVNHQPTSNTVSVKHVLTSGVAGLPQKLAVTERSKTNSTNALLQSLAVLGRSGICTLATLR